MAADGISAALEHLKPKQVVAIHALETERTIAAAARKAGVGIRTLHRWMRQPLFAEVVRRLRVQLYQESRNARLALAGTAIEQLAKMLNRRDTPPGVRARLIQIAFEQADRMSEIMFEEPDNFTLLSLLGMGGAYRASPSAKQDQLRPHHDSSSTRSNKSKPMAQRVRRAAERTS